MDVTSDQRRELQELLNSSEVAASVATRARIVLWWAENRPKKEIAALAGVSRPTVNLWLSRFEVDGVAGLLDRKRGAPREQVPAAIQGRILALTRTSPPAETGLSHWSIREMAAFIKRTTGVYISHRYVAELWRQARLRPHRQGTFKVSRDPEFAHRLPIVVVIFNNSNLHNVSLQQTTPFGTDLYNPDFITLARAYGAEGAGIDGKTDVDRVLRQAFEPRHTPFLIDLCLDPRVMAPLSKWEDTFEPRPGT